MRLPNDDKFRRICREIASECERDGESALVDSDDLYQGGPFCGGWYSDERRFYFSFYPPDGGDYVFSFTLEDARLVAAGGTIDPALTSWSELA